MKNIFTRLIALMLVLALALSLASCGGITPPANDDNGGNKNPPAGDKGDTPTEADVIAGIINSAPDKILAGGENTEKLEQAVASLAALEVAALLTKSGDDAKAEFIYKDGVLNFLSDVGLGMKLQNSLHVSENGSFEFRYNDSGNAIIDVPMYDDVFSGLAGLGGEELTAMIETVSTAFADFELPTLEADDISIRPDGWCVINDEYIREIVLSVASVLMKLGEELGGEIGGMPGVGIPDDELDLPVIEIPDADGDSSEAADELKSTVGEKVELEYGEYEGNLDDIINNAGDQQFVVIGGNNGGMTVTKPDGENAELGSGEVIITRPSEDSGNAGNQIPSLDEVLQLNAIIDQYLAYFDYELALHINGDEVDGAWLTVSLTQAFFDMMTAAEAGMPIDALSLNYEVTYGDALASAKLDVTVGMVEGDDLKLAFVESFGFADGFLNASVGLSMTTVMEDTTGALYNKNFFVDVAADASVNLLLDDITKAGAEALNVAVNMRMDNPRRLDGTKISAPQITEMINAQQIHVSAVLKNDNDGVGNLVVNADLPGDEQDVDFEGTLTYKDVTLASKVEAERKVIENMATVKAYADELLTSFEQFLNSNPLFSSSLMGNFIEKYDIVSHLPADILGTECTLVISLEGFFDGEDPTVTLFVGQYTTDEPHFVPNAEGGFDMVGEVNK